MQLDEAVGEEVGAPTLDVGGLASQFLVVLFERPHSFEGRRLFRGTRRRHEGPGRARREP